MVTAHQADRCIKNQDRKNRFVKKGCLQGSVDDKVERWVVFVLAIFKEVDSMFRFIAARKLKKSQIFLIYSVFGLSALSPKVVDWSFEAAEAGTSGFSGSGYSRSCCASSSR